MIKTGAHKEKLKGLYAITDETLIPEHTFEQSVEAALQGGAKIIQYRDKSNDTDKRIHQARQVRSLCERYQATFIINDDIELTRAVGADGVHLGKNDALLSQARQMLGKEAIIGISCYDDINLAITAEKNSADYVAFGAVFSSSTKPEAVNANISLISDAKKELMIPVCAIGGITEKNIQQLIQHDVDMTAVINALFSADDIKDAANRLGKYFDQ